MLAAILRASSAEFGRVAHRHSAPPGWNGEESELVRFSWASFFEVLAWIYPVALRVSGLFIHTL